MQRVLEMELEMFFSLLIPYHLQKSLKTNFLQSNLATLFMEASEAYTITE